MSIKNRYLESTIANDLKRKMVFLGGPRQVGKTTVSLALLGARDENHPAYLSWDHPQNRKDLLAGILPAAENLIVLDEIHKYKQWRNLVKGLYDKNKSSRKFLITGSAKLDYYRRGGDSLQGRYHYYRLHPFSLYEVNPNGSHQDLEHLLKFGGFPEPFLSGSEVEWKRWQRERQSLVIRQDLVDLEHVKEVSQVDLLASLLPSKVGSILSIPSLCGDIQVAFETADRWLRILENLYYCFRISPYVPSKIKAAKKEKKLYLWDWSMCSEEGGARFENLVASHLLKYCHFIEDTTGDLMELNFLRDKEKREVDFVVLKNRTPLFGVECKTGEKAINANLIYFSSRTTIPYFYQLHLGEKDYVKSEHRIRVMPFTTFSQQILKL